MIFENLDKSGLEIFKLNGILPLNFKIKFRSSDSMKTLISYSWDDQKEIREALKSYSMD